MLIVLDYFSILLGGSWFVYLGILPIVVVLFGGYAAASGLWPFDRAPVVLARAGTAIVLAVSLFAIVSVVVRGGGSDEPATTYDALIEGRTLAESFTIVEWDVVERDDSYVVSGEVRNDGEVAAGLTLWLTLDYSDGSAQAMSIQPHALTVNVPPNALWAFEHEVSARPGARSSELRTSFGRVR